MKISVTANLGQVFLCQVPRLIAIFVITFAISKKFVANLLRNIANLLSQLKTPHFLLETPHFLCLRKTLRKNLKSFDRKFVS